MSWIKYFTKVPVANRQSTETSRGTSSGSTAKFSSYLPEVYAGHPNRIQRYYQYDDMDRDSDIASALDTIADFCTQSEEQSDSPFEIAYYGDDATETEVKIITTALNKWTRLNDFRSKLWHMFRHAIKNGDQFFLRDPETGEWLWIDTFSVEMVKVDDTVGKEPDEYIIRGLDYNKQAKFATGAADPLQYRTPLGTSNVGGNRPVGSGQASAFSLAGSDARNQNGGMNPQDQLFVVDAQHVVHLSLSSGMDINWPFGQSVLEPIFKVFKQKELLEDAIIIYRVQRAPERRIFYIDVGTMPANRAKAHLEQMKNEIHQRRIPNRTGGGASVLDAAYNPLAVMDDFFFAVGSEGRGSKVETLPGGELVGEIGDLLFFSKKMARGLRIPPLYLFGDDSNSMAFNDGKLGTALVQEFLFNKYCMRLQAMFAKTFDYEFKYYLRKTGIEIDENMFELKFSPPQNFSKYRQIELDSQQMQVYSQVAENKHFSERFKKLRWLNMKKEEIEEDEGMWRQENPDKIKKKTGADAAADDQHGLSSVGVRSGAMFPDTGAIEDNPEDFVPDEGGEMPADGGAIPTGGDGGMGAPDAGGGAPPAG